MRDLSRRLCVLAAASLSLGAAAPAGAQQDTWTGVRRIVAVGDVHGDHDQFLKVLRAAGVVDKAANWAAGKTHLVQVGDVLDRGPDSRKAMDLLMKLERQAAKAGGAVHPLIGNHEAMILLDDWRYLHPDEPKAFGGIEKFRQAMGPRGKYGRWIRTHNTAVLINGLLFVHAGITPACARLSLRQINDTVRRELRKKNVMGIASNPFGPLWTRSLALGAEARVAPRLAAVLKRYGATHMVIGHSVETEGIDVRAGGGLIRIDVGMSACYGGPAACLVVENRTFYEVRHGRKKRKLALPAATTRPSRSTPLLRPSRTSAPASTWFPMSATSWA